MGAFARLETAAPFVLYDTIGRGKVVCVVLWALYQPSTEEGEIAAQSDEVTWRYSFRLDAP